MNLPTTKDIREVTTLPDIAKRTGFGLRTLYTWLQNGDVPGSRLAKEYRIKAVWEALESARAESSKPPSPKAKRRAA